MSEPAIKYEIEPNIQPCPFCGGTEFDSNTWLMDDEDSPFTEVDAVECRGCKAGAPLDVWNTRPDPWRYPPEMPREGQRILHTYQGDNGSESSPITGVYYAETWKEHCRPIVRWMAVPEV